MSRCSSEAEQRFRKPQAKGSTPFTGSTFYALPGNGLYLMPPAIFPAPITTVLPVSPYRPSRVSGNPDGTAV